MYKFYQEQPENNWVYHPMRDENREDNEKKDSNNSFAEPKADYFSFGNQESPMGQGQNKRQNFAAHMLPANNRIGTIPAQPQKSNALPGSIATGNEKLKDWKNKLKGALMWPTLHPELTHPNIFFQTDLCHRVSPAS